MQLSEDTPLTEFLVTGYETGTYQVSSTPYTQSIFLTPEQVLPWNEDFAELLKFEVQLVLVRFWYAW